MIKAIVLTCDKYRALTEHMMYRYARTWSNHPFRFRIPYQSLREPDSPGVEYVSSPVAIKATVLTLLDDLDDHEWIYWCIDDKYPITLRLPCVHGIVDWLKNHPASDVDGVLFCRRNKLLRERNLTGNTIQDPRGNLYLERKRYDSIWLHQFLRVGVLRHFFESFPDDIPYAKFMEKLKKKADKPPDHRLFVSEKNLVTYGESTFRGILTRNCYESIVESGLRLPEWHRHTTGIRITWGKLSD